MRLPPYFYTTCTISALTPPRARLSLAFSIACHTRTGVAGMSMLSTPSGNSASISALMMVGGAPMVPDPDALSAERPCRVYQNGTFFYQWNFFRRKSVLNKFATHRKILCLRIMPRCDFSHARD